MEKVLVVKTDIISEYLGKDEFITDNLAEIIDVINENHLFVDREYAENAVEYKQIIPYAVLVNGDEVFLTQRLKAQTEKRLHGLFSFGLGGHINPDEDVYENILVAGMRRELSEEVGLDNLGNIDVNSCVGIINDNSTDVSNFHIGLVYLVSAPKEIEIKEKNKMSGEWMKVDNLSYFFDRFESWSKIVFNSGVIKK